MEDENNVKRRKASTTESEEIMTMMLLSEPSPPPKGIADKLAILKHHITTLEAQITTLEAQITTLEAQITTLEAQITTLEAQITTPQDHITTLEDKITSLKSQIGDVEKQLDDKERELESMKQTGNTKRISKKQIELRKEKETISQKKETILQKQIELRKEKETISQKIETILQKQIELRKEKETILRKQKELSKQHTDLENGFLKGEYYAWTSEVWKIEEVTRKGNEWQSFVRSLKDKEKFQCRYPKKRSDDEKSTPDPYNNTINGAQNSKCAVPNSATAVSSSYPQSDTAARDVVWPKDIFGNQIQTQPIAHLVPAGQSVAHKQWLNVAAAVLGIPSTATLDVKKKAARGFIPEKGTHAGGTQSKSNSDKKEKKRPKMPGTGVIHFVTNKIRFEKQKDYLDGTNPTVLIVPVMTLDGAKNWRGEGYSAICLAGYPSGSPFDVINVSNIYTEIKLGSKSLLENQHPRDAKPEEVNIACDFLRAAVLALHDMIANLSQDELTLGKNPNHKDNTLQQASEEAQNLSCKVPGPVTPLGEKPACLLTFGGHEDVDMHPAPDPLLLVLKAANIFGIMAKMKMLANGSSDDDSDISMGDIIEEEAFLEARERALRPQTWEDLARGLGQPYGYVASTNYLKQMS
ncbi:hypothetical protein IV203_018836 [Nitzschia inconspicua]|uniref:Uncharacterized protein n=1 Tax=Nitzschia inconspicua TaxID=303405 RepID=A0A9K3M2R8_9STRA|nr:hypothetical protein IV203_018836 [Nitzschia inconspicua]